MGVTVAVTRVACNTSTGIQSITTSDCGGLTPKAALFLWSHATSDGVAADGVAEGSGFTDGSTSSTFTLEYEHGVSTSDVLATIHGSTTICIRMFDATADTVNAGLAYFSSWVTNGIEVDWDTAPSAAYLLTVVFFCGSDLSVKVGYVSLGTTAADTEFDVTGPGFEPDVLFCYVSKSKQLGFVSSNRSGTVLQTCTAVANRTGVTTTQNNIIHRTNRGAYELGATGLGVVNFEFANFDSSGFSVYPRDNNADNNILHYLALRFGSSPVVQSKAYSFQTPTSTGSSTDTGPGFQPQIVFYVTSLVEADNSIYTDSRAGVWGVSAITSNAQYHHTYASVDNVSTSDTQSLSDNQAVNLPLEDGSAGMAATFSAFTSSGLTLSWTDVESNAKYWAALAIGAAAGVSGSASLSPSPSISGSPSASPSISRSASLSGSPSASPSLSASPSVSPSISGSPSASPSISRSASVSPSVSGSASASPSISGSASASPSISLSPSVSPSISGSPSVSPSISGSPSVSLSISGSPSASPSISGSASVSPSISGSASASPSVSPSASVSLSISPSASASPSMPSGSVCWGHVTGVTEDNIKTFSGNWTGTGTISGTGDNEVMCLDEEETMTSEVVETGALLVTLLQNVYKSGDEVTIKYRHGATVGDCTSAEWIDYTVPFTSLGYVQVQVSG